MMLETKENPFGFLWSSLTVSIKENNFCSRITMDLGFFLSLPTRQHFLQAAGQCLIYYSVIKLECNLTHTAVETKKSKNNHSFYTPLKTPFQAIYIYIYNIHNINYIFSSITTNQKTTFQRLKLKH